MVSISTLGRTLEQIENIKSQQSSFATLNTQLVTGKKSQTFSGLGTDDITSLRARSEISLLQSYSDSISRSDVKIQTMVRKIDEFEQQAANFADALLDFPRQSSLQKGNIVTYDDPATLDVDEGTEVGYDSADPIGELKNIQDFAGKMYDVLADLLNFQDGDDYAFAGASSTVQPFTDNGSLDTAVSNLLVDWKDGNIGTEALIADFSDGTSQNGNANAINDNLIGYSSELTSGTTEGVFVRADSNTQIEYTALANEDGFRDIMVALSVVKNGDFVPIHDAYINNEYPAAPDVQGAPGGNIQQQKESFYALFDGLTKMVVDSIDDLQSVKTRLEQSRVQMDSINKSHVEDINLLISTVSSVEDVDINEVALSLTTLQTSLEASYSVTALVRDLSLTRFL